MESETSGKFVCRFGGRVPYDRVLGKLRKNSVHDLQHHGRTTPTSIQILSGNRRMRQTLRVFRRRLTSVVQRTLKVGLDLIEDRRDSASPTVNRLFAVPYAEKTPRSGRDDPFGDWTQNRPLERRGILEFIEE